VTDFDELRLLIQPDGADPNSWSVHVQKCPRAEYQDLFENTQLRVTPADLQLLRNASAPPDLLGLQQLGKKVIDSIMPPGLQTGLQVCVADAEKNKRGLRLVISMLGDARAPQGIRNRELPVEAAFHQKLSFLGNNIRTPVSRGVAIEPDREPVPIPAPLKVLVVASEPTDMPQVNAAAEKQAILDALKNLINSNAVKVDFCEPPTLAQMDLMVQKKSYHVVHFIGHGDFEIAGLDPNPQPHLYFEDNTPNRRRHAADLQQLYTVLRNGRIPLIVLTACSTAASSPNGADYPVSAFDSLAYSLVQFQAGPSAAVAMQFDLETQAAAVFSKTFYEKLLDRKWGLDEAVASTRSALISTFSAGHRSWVNPTVYWRCKEGRLFTILNTSGTLTPEEQQKITAIDTQIEVYEGLLNELAQKSAQEQAGVANLREQWRLKILDLLRERGVTLGDTVRLRGGVAAADGIVECSLTLQLRLPATIGDVTANISYDAADLTYVDSVAGASVPPAAVFPQENGGQLSTILVQNASQGVSWSSNEYELCKLRFKVNNPNNKPLLYIKLTLAQVEHDSQLKQLQSLNATVFGT
jgi:CHAT domain-containing protein